MDNISKGDKILNTNTNVEYVVDVVETYGNTTVVFTEGVKSTCLPISEIIKIPKSWLANYFLKKLKGFEITDFEEKKFNETLIEFKPVTIKPFCPIEFDYLLKECLKNSTEPDLRVP
jgi:hypothetical protein